MLRSVVACSAAPPPVATTDAARENAMRRLALGLAEPRLVTGADHLVGRAPGRLLHLAVDVDERDREQPRDPRAGLRLARAAQAHEEHLARGDVQRLGAGLAHRVEVGRAS